MWYYFLHKLFAYLVAFALRFVTFSHSAKNAREIRFELARQCYTSTAISMTEVCKPGAIDPKIVLRPVFANFRAFDGREIK